MYKCCDCGHVFDSGEEFVHYETHGLPNPPYERFAYCPNCHGDYEEAEKCEICGGDYLYDELTMGVCEECISDRSDFDTCLRIGQRHKESVWLNSFLVSMFDVSQIEQMLTNILREANKLNAVDCSKYVDEDKSWFAEALCEEVKLSEIAKVDKRRNAKK